MNGPYEDIIHLSRPTSPSRVRMPMADRAAQFSPFAALTGYEDAVAETARLTDQKIELDVDAGMELDAVLARLHRQPAGTQRVTVVYFVPDLQKTGGAYVKKEGMVQRINVHEGWLRVDDSKIAFDDMLSIEEISSPQGAYREEDSGV